MITCFLCFFRLNYLLYGPKQEPEVYMRSRFSGTIRAI
jgi:hypothetical protein